MSRGTEAVQVGPNNAQMQRVMASKVTDMVGVHLWRGGHDRSSAQDQKLFHFKRSIELNPHHADTFLNYGVALSIVGRPAEALEVRLCAVLHRSACAAIQDCPRDARRDDGPQL